MSFSLTSFMSSSQDSALSTSHTSFIEFNSSYAEADSQSDLIQEKVRLSERLISRFLKSSMTGENNRKTKLTNDHQETIEKAEILSETSQLVAPTEKVHHSVEENIDLFPKIENNIYPLDVNVARQEKRNQLREGHLLPDYAALHAKVESADGVINFAHANLGDQRCIILSNALNDSTEDPYAKRKKIINIDDDSYEVYSLSLCDNRITDSGMQAIMRNMMSAKRLYNLRHLDLSDNNIGNDGAISLARCICMLPELQRLNISNMNLCDGALANIFTLLSSSGPEEGTRSMTFDDDNKPFLQSLKLSKNSLSTTGAKALANFLGSSTGSELLELDISWNVLGIEGAALLWAVLTDHKCLIALDVSWNSLGDHNHEEMGEKILKPTMVNPLTVAEISGDSKVLSEKSMVQDSRHDAPPDLPVVPLHGRLHNKSKRIKYESAMALRNLLKCNDTLLHLNIAQNALCAKECEIIGEGLQANHVLLGIHITGNSGRVDSYGYMVSDTTSWPLDTLHHPEPIIHDASSKDYHNSIRCNSLNKKMNYYDRNSCSNRNACWVCGGWKEVEFAYRLTEEDVKNLNEVIAFNKNNYTVQRRDKISELFPVHFFASFDNWHPERMRLPSPSEVQQQHNAAPVHCTLQNHQSNTPSNSFKQGNPDHRQNYAPKSPSQSKPSKANTTRRRSSLSNLSVKMFSSDSQNLKPIGEEFELTEKFSHDASNREEQSEITPKHILPIARHKSIDNQIQADIFIAQSEKERELDKEKETNDNILLYDEIVGEDNIEDSSRSERNRKTILKIKPLKNNNCNEPQSPVAKSKSRRNRSVDDIARLKAKTVVLEGEMGLIYRLRRMVPPGRHSYVFAVGLDFDKQTNSGGANTVIDVGQPNNLTTLALTQDSINFARSQGVSLPKRVNTIFLFNSELIRRGDDRYGAKDIPKALVLANKLGNPINPRPRFRHMPTLGRRKKLWNRMESVLYKQWQNHQKKYTMECCACDWKQMSLYALLMRGSSDDYERHDILNTIKEYYPLLKSVYDYYWATHCADSSGLTGLAYNEIVKQCHFVGPATNELGMSHLKLYGSEHTTAGGRRRSSSLPADEEDESGDIIKSENDGGTPERHPDSSIESNAFSVEKGSRKVVAMNPRGTKAIIAPRSSAMMQQITLNRNIPEISNTVSSSDDDDDDDDDNCSLSELSIEKTTSSEDVNVSKAKSVIAKERFIERRLSSAEDILNRKGSSPRKQSIVGGKVLDVNDLPWNSGKSDGSCTLQDIDMVFISNCVTGKKEDMNNKRSLLRFQFLDCIVAVACIKYLNTGICKSISLAFAMFVGNNIGRYASTRDDERFKKLMLPSKPIDTIIKLYLTKLKPAFNKMSLPTQFNTNVRSVKLTTWMRLCDISGLEMGDRIYKQCFIYSKMQGIADMFDPSCQYKELLFIEFIEAIVRISYSKQLLAIEKGMRRPRGSLSEDELNMHVTVETVGQVLKETLKIFIKNASQVQDTF